MQIKRTMKKTIGWRKVSNLFIYYVFRAVKSTSSFSELWLQSALSGFTFGDTTLRHTSAGYDVTLVKRCCGSAN